MKSDSDSNIRQLALGFWRDGFGFVVGEGGPFKQSGIGSREPKALA